MDSSTGTGSSLLWGTGAIKDRMSGYMSTFLAFKLCNVNKTSSTCNHHGDF